MSTFQEISSQGGSFEQCAKIYDTLEPATLDSMLSGRWKGVEITTGHSTDGMLDAMNWYGIDFVSFNEVHPLVITSKSDGTLFRADPGKTMAGVDPAEAKVEGPGARLRMVEFRGVSTATMVYNDLPICDHFRKVDQNTVMGMMDNPMIPGDNSCFYMKRDTAR